MRASNKRYLIGSLYLGSAVIFGIATATPWIVADESLLGNSDWSMYTMKSLGGSFNPNFYLISFFVTIVLLAMNAMKHLGVRGLPNIINYSGWIATVSIAWDVFQGFQKFGFSDEANFYGVQLRIGIGVWLALAAAGAAIWASIIEGSRKKIGY